MATDDAYVLGLGYHSQMHRAYRAVRARVAQRMSVIHPAFAATVLDEFRAVVKMLRLDEKLVRINADS